MNTAPVVGVVTLTDPRQTAHARAREEYLSKEHSGFVACLRSHGITVVDPASSMKLGSGSCVGVRSSKEVRECAQAMQAADVEAIIICLWHWTEPALALEISKLVDRPVLLYTEDDPDWAGATALTAVGASLWEAAPNYYSCVHQRIRSDREGVLQWIRGAAASARLRQANLLLWGGSYGLRMEHLRDDYATLKRRFVRDIIEEDQYVLVRYAERILEDQPERIKATMSWLQAGGAKIEPDGQMFTIDILRHQIALYLAARDRVSELEKSIGIDGVSVRCQPELSNMYGFTPCLIPSFLAYGEDSEGSRVPYPVVCEGDVKGLVTSVLMTNIAGGVPPMFGDLKYVCDEYLLLSNCGGSSVYYAANSPHASDVLPHVALRPQCQGAAGCAVGYRAKPGTVTLARLIRAKGAYYMQLGLGQIREAKDMAQGPCSWGQTWPSARVDLGVSPDVLLSAAGSNHYSMLAGDHIAELLHACRQMGVAVVRIDSETSMCDFIDELGQVNG